jgi:hypothetical protein
MWESYFSSERYEVELLRHFDLKHDSAAPTAQEIADRLPHSTDKNNSLEIFSYEHSFSDGRESQRTWMVAYSDVYRRAPTH